jgi:hypothetical protein
MSPLPFPVLPRRRPRRPKRPSRGRNRPSKVAISTLVMMAIRSRMPAIRSALVVTAVWLIATGTYLSFQDDVLTRLFGHQTKMQMSGLFLDQKQVEQQLITLLQRQATLEQLTSTLNGDLSTTGTIKPDRIAPPEAMPAEKPTPTSLTNETETFVAPPEGEARLSPELRASATKKHRQIHRAASLQHRVGAPPPAAASEKTDAGIVNQ